MKPTHIILYIALSILFVFSNTNLSQAQTFSPAAEESNTSETTGETTGEEYAVDKRSFNIETDIFEEDFEEESEEDGTSFSLWIPGILVKATSLFVKKSEEPEIKAVLKSLGSMKIMVREGTKHKPRFSRKYKRVSKRIKRQNFEELIKVHSDDANICVSVKTKRNKIRGFTVIVDESDTFVLFKAKGKIDIKQLTTVTNRVVNDEVDFFDDDDLELKATNFENTTETNDSSINVNSEN